MKVWNVVPDNNVPGITIEKFQTNINTFLTRYNSYYSSVYFFYFLYQRSTSMFAQSGGPASVYISYIIFLRCVCMCLHENNNNDNPPHLYARWSCTPFSAWKMSSFLSPPGPLWAITSSTISSWHLLLWVVSQDTNGGETRLFDGETRLRTMKCLASH